MTKFFVRIISAATVAMMALAFISCTSTKKTDSQKQKQAAAQVEQTAGYSDAE